MNAVVALLQAEGELLDAYIAALEAEDRALLAARYDDLPAIGARKTDLLDKIAETDAQRETMLAERGFTPDRARRPFAEQRTPAAVVDAWEGLLRRAERARRLNLRVAAKVYTNLEFTSNALSFLKAHGKPLYGPDGAREVRAASTRLAVG